MRDQPAGQRGPGVFSRLGRPEEHDLTAARRDEIAIRLRRYLGPPG